MAEENRDSKWEGKSMVELRSITADQVWSFIEDFYSLVKWFPGVNTCRQVKGVYGQPGHTVYVDFIRLLPPPDNSDQPPESVVKWCYQTLVSIDPVQRCLSYQTSDNSFGLGFYVAEWKVIDIKDGGVCRIEWRFTTDPIEGHTLEGFSGLLQGQLNDMGERMEKALQDANLK